MNWKEGMGSGIDMVGLEKSLIVFILDDSGMTASLAEKACQYLPKVLLISLAPSTTRFNLLSTKLRHVSSYGAADASYWRSAAAAWMQELPWRARDASGRCLLDALSYDSFPLWWFIEISLQEKAFLAVRLIHQIRLILAEERPTHFAILGSHDAHPWKADVIARVCWDAGIAEVDVKPWAAEAVADRSAPSPTTLIPIAGERAIRLLRVTARNRLNVFLVAGRALGVSTKNTTRLIRLILTSLLPYGLVLLGRKVRPWSVKILHYLANLSKRLRFVVFLVLPYGLVARSGGIRRVLKTALQLCFASLSRSFLRLALLGQPSGGCVMLLEENWDVRTAVSILGDSVSAYNPYLEGIWEELRATLGRRRAMRAVLGLRKHLGWDLRALAGRTVFLSEQPPIHLRWRLDPVALWEDLNRTPGFRQAFSYDGVDLWDVFQEDLHQLLLALPWRIGLYENFKQVLESLKPSAIIMYNFEGFFRPCLAAAIRKSTPVLGIQQALGPYVHSLDHSRSGYRLPGTGGPQHGCPTPTRLAVWGCRHAELLRSYGYPPEVLTVTGSPRLDGFVARRERLDRQALLNALGIAHPSSRVITFAGVYRVIGTTVLRREHYVATLRSLWELVKEDERVVLIIKPWHGERLEVLWDLILAAIPNGYGRVIVVEPKSLIHNAEFLAVTDVLVSTFSSIFAEALVMGARGVLLHYPEARAYFGDEHVNLFRGMVEFVHHPREVKELIREALAREGRGPGPEALRVLSEVFGPCDGLAGRRIVQEVLAAGGVAGSGTRQPAAMPRTRIFERHN